MNSPRGIVWCPYCACPHSLQDRVCSKTGRNLPRELHRETNPVQHPLLGQTLGGKYLVLSVLSSSPSGIVFAGEALPLRRPVAIKVVLEGSSDTAKRRLEREGAIVASLLHPNICHLYDVGELPSFGPFLVTERLEGETVAQRFRFQREFTPAATVDILAQVLSGLQAAHAQGVVHRDLKPQNVFLVERGGCAPIAKILDFGSAKDLSAVAPTLTQPGSVLGTPQYMSPEQLVGKEIDQRADLFAVGVMAYEMLTGKHPFQASSAPERQARILRDRPTVPSEVNRRLGRGFDAVLLHALEKHPNDRFRDAHEMQSALVHALAAGA